MKIKNSILTIIAYMLMVIIWSTTPLAIKWSSQGVDFITGLFGRMLIGGILATLLALLWYKKIPWHKDARRVYWASALSIYGAMMLVYWGAQYIPSGLISVLYGLSPIFTTVFTFYLLTNESMNKSKIIGAAIGVMGLIIIFFEQISLGEKAVLGISAVLVSVLFHSISAVYIKRLNTQLPALIITSGGLNFSIPLFIVTFIFFAEPLPLQIPLRTFWVIFYLGIMGSVIGFVSYYYVLSKLSPSTVALATLITPITALWLGKMLNHETISLSVLMGSVFVLTGLLIHQWYDMLIKKYIR